MEKEILITTSFGLVKDAADYHFAQLIREDEYGNRNDLFFPLTEKEATRISKLMKAEICSWDCTISSYNHDIVG